MSFLRTKDKRKRRVSPEDVLRQLEQSQLRRSFCIDDMTQKQIDEMLRRPINIGGQITIDITPAVEPRIKADRRKGKQ